MANHNQNFFGLNILILVFLISLSNNIIEIPIQSIEKSLSSKQETILVDNFLLIGKVKIGSNNQEFNLVLDTTSSITWVALNGSNDSFTINNHYNPNESKTSKKTDKQFEIEKFGYFSKGYYYDDEIQFMDNKKLNFKFGSASETKLDAKNIDGMIGLAYNYEEEQLSFLNSLKNSGITDTLSFSISIDGNESKLEINGTMYLGKHEDFSKKETISCPLKFDKYKDYWSYNIKSFILNNTLNEIKSEKTFQFIFDTASNSIVLPEEYFNDIKNNLAIFGCKYVTSGNIGALTYNLACEDETKLPNIKLKINGQMFIIPKEFAFYQHFGISYSKIIFQGENAIIGTPFFILFHTLFDKEKKMLRFYPKQSEWIERGQIEEEDPESDSENKGFNINYLFYIIPSIIIVIIIIIIVIVFVRKKKGNNKDNFEFGLEQNDEENALVN